MTKIQPQQIPAMVDLYRSGSTFKEIGIAHGLSRERVRQILRYRLGIGAQASGRLARRMRVKAATLAAKEARSLAKFGCSRSQYAELIEIGREMMREGASFCRTPTGAWHSQRRSAMMRGIPWQISLWDWWMVWKISGKWGHRGRGRGYMMCRIGDQGAYSLDNVYIATGSHNATLRHHLRT